MHLNYCTCYISMQVYIWHVQVFSLCFFPLTFRCSHHVKCNYQYTYQHALFCLRTFSDKNRQIPTPSYNFQAYIRVLGKARPWQITKLSLVLRFYQLLFDAGWVESLTFFYHTLLWTELYEWGMAWRSR